jgi:hypothetical protein
LSAFCAGRQRRHAFRALGSALGDSQAVGPARELRG